MNKINMRTCKIRVTKKAIRRIVCNSSSKWFDPFFDFSTDFCSNYGYLRNESLIVPSSLWTVEVAADVLGSAFRSIVTEFSSDLSDAMEFWDKESISIIALALEIQRYLEMIEKKTR